MWHISKWFYETAQYGLDSSTQANLLIIRSLKYENSGEKVQGLLMFYVFNFCE